MVAIRYGDAGPCDVRWAPMAPTLGAHPGAALMETRKLGAGLVAAALAGAAVLGLRAAGRLQSAELALYDGFVSRAEHDPSAVVVVEITEDDIRALGHWPLSDDALADLLASLAAAGPRVIGLDLYRDLPVPPGTPRLERILREEPRIVGLSKFGDPARGGIPGPQALAGTDRVGFSDVPLDPDEVVRRALLFQDDGRVVATSFALQVATRALEAEGIRPGPDPSHPDWIRLGAATLPPLGPDHGGYSGVDAAGYQFLLDFAAASFERVPVGDLLAGRVDPAELRDRVVLVGTRAESLPDMLKLPHGRSLPGVEVHAHAVDQLLRLARGDSRPMRVLSGRSEVALIAAAALLAAAIGTAMRGRTSVGAVILAAGALGGPAVLWAVGWLGYAAGWWFPVAAPSLAWVGGLGLSVAWAASRERAERAQLMRIFARHVSPEVADAIWRKRDEILVGGRLRPQQLTATVLVLDMRGFTEHLKKFDPEALMAWLGDFIEAMARQVGEHGGVVDDYFGDGLKADFGVPIPRGSREEIAVDAERAVGCAVAMAAALDRVNASHRARGLPEVGMRIGIATGSVVTGSMGSLDRLKYTTIGDVVVTAQRLEATTSVAHDFERWPTRILIAESTYRLLEDRIDAEPVGSVPITSEDDRLPAYRVPLDGVPLDEAEGGKP